ncbi:uncharacterized protein LOC121576698 [Coregonus clupeaformis]|uniref:uncharacterized protein LOC121576698 n=1 Tax=Coregonus clupeaformis TaxID=59861 RepID=UPI001BE0D5C5|nr:uncharacterized protein LOC121576698 [Coregonus clupeaformis]
MEERGLENHFKPSEMKCLEIIPTLPMWIIEYAWAHRMMDTLDGLDPSRWPEDDLQSLTLDEPWRLRVAAAQAYSIMKTRDIKSFERVMEFLDVTYTLLPRLVPPIKHMKIMFGLKTMIIMWMLREDQGIVNTVVKTITFFPSRLPQYHECSRQEMHLMRKNHQDFKALAQTLAMDMSMRKAYIKDLMEDQYGECYAQKLEDRLLHYLQELESTLQSDTYFDQLLKQECPMAYEEELLLPLITCDSTSLAASLKRLFHSAESSSRCHPSHKMGVGPAQERGIGRELEDSGTSKVALRLPKERTHKDGQSQPDRTSLYASQGICQDNREERSNSLELGPRHACAAEQGLEPQALIVEPGVDLSKDSPLLLEEDVSDGKEGKEGSRGRTEEVEDRQNNDEVPEASPLQLCSKHQKWVRSILQECSEELLCEKTDTPEHCQGSSSTSSQDLTPSLLTLCPPQHLTLATQNPYPAQPVAVSQPMALNDRAHSEQAGETADSPEASRTHRVKLRLSMESQALLLKSKFLQPFVRLRKLTQQECSMAAELRGTRTPEEEDGDDDDGEEEDDDERVEKTPVYSYYDVNTLYSSFESSSDEDPETQDSDLDYVP